MDRRLPTNAAAGTELLSEGLDAQAGAYMIVPTPGGHNHNFSSPATKGAAGAPAINFNAADAIEAAGYEEEASSVATMMKLARGIGGNKAITAAATGVVLVDSDDEGGHNFADPVVHSAMTTVDLARMKAEETIAEATSAAMKIAKEAGDVLAGAGHKLL